MTSSCTAAAAPCPAPARRTPRLMLTSPLAAAGRAPRGRRTAGGPGDDPSGRLPAAKRLQGQRSARPSGGWGRSAWRPAAVSEAGEPSAPDFIPQAAPPPASPAPGHAPSDREALWELWSHAAGRAPQAGRRGRRQGNPGTTAAETAPPPRGLGLQGGQ